MEASKDAHAGKIQFLEEKKAIYKNHNLSIFWNSFLPHISSMKECIEYLMMNGLSRAKHTWTGYYF